MRGLPTEAQRPSLRHAPAGFALVYCEATNHPTQLSLWSKPRFDFGEMLLWNEPLNQPTVPTNSHMKLGAGKVVRDRQQVWTICTARVHLLGEHLRSTAVPTRLLVRIHGKMRWGLTAKLISGGPRALRYRWILSAV